MARPAAVGLRYTPWDVGVLENDSEIDKLVGAQGACGFMVYFAICQRAASRTGYYYCWDEDQPAVLARKLGGGVTAICVEQTVALCLRIGLFDKGLFERESVLTSRRLQRNFVAGIHGRKSKVEVCADYWLLSGEESGSLIRYTANPNMQRENPHLRQDNTVNEMKLNEMITPVTPTENDCGKPCGKKARQTKCTELLSVYFKITGVRLWGSTAERRAIYRRADAGASWEQMEKVLRVGAKRHLMPSAIFGEQWETLCWEAISHAEAEK